MRTVIFLFFLLLSVGAYSDEGMWQPYQLPGIKKELKSLGLKLDPKKMTQLTEFPMAAVIGLNGCSASFVSPKGLVITNHHCAYGSLQYNSTEEKNVLEEGLLAKTYQEELPAAPGSRVYVTIESVDVSEKVTANVTDNLEGYERYQVIEKNKKQLIANCETDQKYRCRIITYHSGLQYFLFKQLAIRDVRLVYAPAKAIGRYGGLADNWLWPRHTGDYTFLRAYVDKDGQPADYSEDNVPYQPKHYFKFSNRDLHEGDFVMVIGYPGTTNRYRTASAIKNRFTWVYPKAKQYREEFIDIIKQHSEKGSEARIKYESELSNLKNYAQNYESLINSYNKTGFQDHAEQFRTGLQNWIASDKKRSDEYSDVIGKLDSILEQQEKYQKRDYAIAYMERTKMISAAKMLYRLAKEREKPDIDRDPGYQERNLKNIKQSLQRITRRYDSAIDKAAMKHFLMHYSKLSKDQHLQSMDRFFGIRKSDWNASKLQKQLDAMYKHTQLGDEVARLAWMDKSVSDFQVSSDPFIKLAVATYDDDEAIRQYDRNLEGMLQQVRSRYMEVLIAYNKSLQKPIYADANGSLRITYGTVKPYSPKDGLRTTTFTTLQGIVEKDTGVEPFNSPEKQLSLIKRQHYGPYMKKSLGSVPVNFLSNLDITGGNSGSPTLNARGEVVGLVFDGVYEGIISGWNYDGRYSRAIHVDSRYILWVMKYIDQADNLLNEIGIIH